MVGLGLKTHYGTFQALAALTQPTHTHARTLLPPPTNRHDSISLNLLHVPPAVVAVALVVLSGVSVPGVLQV